MENILRSNIREYLRGKHTTLWLNWDLTDPEQLEQAVTFVAELYQDIFELNQNGCPND